MKYNDICKFTPTSFIETLNVECFVMETNMALMRKPKTLKKHCMVLVLKGEGTFRFGIDNVRFKSGSLVFGFENELFSTESSDEVVYMYINFSGNRAVELFRRFNVKSVNRVFDGFDGLIPLWSESLCRASEQTVDLASESMLLYTFSRLAGRAEQLNDLVSRILEIVEKQFDNPDLSMSVVSKNLAYNSKYISHVFKKNMGVSFSEYLRSVRIKFAVSLFDHGLDSVKNVALLSGFYDPLYFSTVFKKVVGVSPKEYAKKVLEQKEMPV